MKYLFLDTNIYLHYIDFEQIDWKGLVGDDYTIVVPQIVIREIDKHKDNSKGKIQSKAKAISKKFGDIFLDGAKVKCPVIDCSDPQITLFDGKEFNININDDWIVLSAIDSGFEETDIYVISGDNNLLIKAKKAGLKYIRMPEEYLCKPEESEIEKENRRIKKELEEYKNRMSKAIVVFDNEEETCVYTRPKVRIIESELEEYVKDLKQKNPYYTPTSKKQNGPYDILGISNLALHNLYSEEDVRTYNDKLDKYFEDCARYQRFLIEKEIMEDRFRPLRFSLVNDGNAQTGDVNIFIDIPDDIKLYNEESVKRIDERNIPVPQIGLLNIDIENLVPVAITQYGGKPQIKCWDVDSPMEDNHIKFVKSRLNQQLVSPLNNQELLYIDTGLCQSFSIHWYCIDSNRPNITEGDLHVIIKEGNLS